MHTYSTLTKDLERMGLRRNDTVLVHSSMKSIGDVEGRADTVLDALSDYFKDDGLLALPTLTWSNVNAESPIYNVRLTPSVVGILPELFRQRPGVIRSLHPTHSIAALGKYADVLTEGHERFDSPCHRYSPWGRLAASGAKIIFIGASISSNTILHGVEEWAQATDVLSESHQQLVCIDYDGRSIPVPSRRHIGGHSSYYGKLENRFKTIGAYDTGVFGDAKCIILDAKKITSFVFRLIKRYPAAFTRQWNEEHPNFFQDYQDAKD
ncbi:MAG: AAC(3) family N-acetyltransferase [Lentisphaerae bacterium]|jgi:aminoglycoside 3-N-acetyltransferase|nr:AAC(3) family N-acetyltransferase [Lentisphaerota bacterium]